ncbi:MAG: hypothetical protein ACRDPR_20215 [Nocardioidaceae bacterium]
MLNYDRRPSSDHPLDERLAALLAAAAAPTEPGAVPGEADAVAAFRASHDDHRRFSMLSSLTPAKTAAAAALSVGVLLTGGVGAAMAGSLPGAAQQTAHDMLTTVGIEVPGAAEASAGHADERGASEDAGPGSVAGSESGKGDEVSELATTTESTGVEKGTEISELASEGKSRAGEQEASGAESSESSESSDDSDGATTDAPPVEAPNAGGTGTADDATEGDSSTGTGTADEKSSGSSEAGSENRQ